ncbi:cysteine synthase A [Eubacterium brachy ATCC 33089]|jgi:cysteine synthase A|nr:cysteine synthase A [Eubacterium brachy ATCC 33089]
MRIYKNITELIGKTPLIALENYGKDLEGNLIVKLERNNPAGSIKDRAAKYMIEEAEKKGVLKDGSTIIEPTSGNTGIGIAAIAASKGYKAIIVMSEAMTVERQNLIKAYGAEVVLTPAAGGMKASIEKAEELSYKVENSWIAGQFDNRDNVKAHIETTGPEIWEDTDGNVDFLVAGIGTGGTLTGTGEYLKSKNPSIKVIAVEPKASPVLTEGIKAAAPHKIQGIGAGFIPSILNTTLYDEVISVSNEDAWETTRQLAVKEGLLCGISSGAALAAGRELASRPENKKKNIVVILPDTGERYLSSGVFGE